MACPVDFQHKHYLFIIKVLIQCFIVLINFQNEMNQLDSNSTMELFKSNPCNFKICGGISINLNIQISKYLSKTRKTYETKSLKLHDTCLHDAGQQRTTKRLEPKGSTPNCIDRSAPSTPQTIFRWERKTQKPHNCTGNNFNLSTVIHCIIHTACN